MTYLKIEAYATHLQISRTTVYQLIKKGLPVIRMGKKCTRIEQETADEWIESRPYILNNRKH